MLCEAATDRKNEKEMKQMSFIHNLGTTMISNLKASTERSAMESVLNNLKKIANSESLTTEQKEPLLHQLQVAEERFNDSKLNLAIIGEFSCGKSTFINALFRREILSTNMQPTTAVPTYITWNNSPTDDPYKQYAVTVYDVDGNTYSLVREEDREKFEAFAGIQLSQDAERLIDAVTTDNRLTGIVSKVTIEAPIDAQYKGICLIDTPGVNPGTEGTAEHVRITQEVLRDSADAAIIMFPADQVYTASFGKFLEENASHLLKHSIFIITKCDIIRSEHELKSLCDFVSYHLSQIGVADLEVHCISASSALDAYLDGDKISKDDKMWKRRFEATNKTIFKELANRRSSIVHENVTNVVDQITRLLTDSLSAKKKGLDKIREDLIKYSPERMKTECEELLKVCKIKMLEKKNARETSVSDVIGSAIENKRASTFNAIDGCNTKDSLSHYLEGFNSHAMSTINSAISSHINGFNQSLDSIFSNYKQQLGDCYKRYELNISTAQVNTLHLGEAEKMNTDELKTAVNGYFTGSKFAENIGDYIDGVFDSDSFVEGVLKAAGGIIALPFALVGWLFNALRSLDSMKNDAKNKVRFALESNRTTACEKLKESISKIYDGYLSAARKLPEKMVELFSVEFSRAQNSYNNQMQSINNQISQLNDQLGQLRKIASRFSKN